jgi:hypothetical protein
MTQAEFAAAYEFSIRTVQKWERGAKKPSGPARTLLRAIKADPEGIKILWRSSSLNSRMSTTQRSPTGFIAKKHASSAKTTGKRVT